MSSKALPQTPVDVEEVDVLNETPIALNASSAPVEFAHGMFSYSTLSALLETELT